MNDALMRFLRLLVALQQINSPQRGRQTIAETPSTISQSFHRISPDEKSIPINIKRGPQRPPARARSKPCHLRFANYCIFFCISLSIDISLDFVGFNNNRIRFCLRNHTVIPNIGIVHDDLTFARAQSLKIKYTNFTA